MKPTQEQILSALNKLVRENKTELKSEKIELGVIDDIEKIAGQANKYDKDVSSMVKEAKKVAPVMEKARKSVDKIQQQNIDNLNESDAMIKKLKKSEKVLIKQAKELGLSASDIPAYKEVKRIINVFAIGRQESQKAWETIYQYAKR